MPGMASSSTSAMQGAFECAKAMQSLFLCLLAANKARPSLLRALCHVACSIHKMHYKFHGLSCEQQVGLLARSSILAALCVLGMCRGLGVYP